MKKLTLSLGVLTALLAANSSFAATTGSVYINGKIEGQTCRLTDDSVTQHIRIPTGYTRDLGNAGDVSPQQERFAIKIIECEKNVTAGIRFDRTNVEANNAGTLRNIYQGRNAAKNVNIQLLHEDKPINLAAQTQDHYLTTITYDDTINYQYAARYYATAQAERGEVRTLTTFQIDYK
ncbi:fimbrial protein [Acinetobacter larvae]|uniref:Uncharacterized protein n=1 Tax=Acinetobacter larvae TaxID=1789224 RepID=A0A1B2M0K1_9GAMM|nr:fimbrial protein [Acinetobacter larvae]AOA58705.1 hypothetical protein BFG52_10295 [Acinetobacter larvae]